MTIQELGKQFKNHFGFNPPIDMIMTMIKGPTNAQIDIIKLDDMFSQHDLDYNNIKCTYKKQKDISMNTYVEMKYGKDALKFLENNM
jgi:hypothetical protein